MYDRVNDALNAVLLDGRYEARPLYLVLDNTARRELADLLDCDEGEVEETCCLHVGESLGTSGDPYRPHDRALRAWRARGKLTKPPMTALLYTLAHAAELMANSGEFTSGNYYRRLEQLTGAENWRLSQFGSSTEKFWRAFSKWLSETDYQYGQPTARQINAFRYVSLAVSQAIVRAADRECFHHLFEKYGFSSTDTLNEEEMGHYIGSWIHSSGANQRLKSAWQKTDLRPRICEVALAELEQWTRQASGSETGAEQGLVGLSLSAAIIADFPSRKLALSVGRRGEMENDVELEMEDGEGSKFVLGNSTYGTFASVAPASSLDFREVLARGVCFERADGAGAFAWRPRVIIPFSRSESGPYWTEVNRTTVGMEHIVLVRAGGQRRQEVEEILSAVAVPGYTAATSQHLVGMPDGWVLYEGVRLLKAVDGISSQLAALSPVSDTGGLQVLGGLPLSRSIWHRSAPPSVHLEAREGRVRLEVLDGMDGGGDVVAQHETVDSPAHLALEPELIPEEGVLFARALLAGKVIGSANLLFRSAARPRPLDRQSRGRLAYRSLTSASLLEDANEGVITVEGVLVNGPLPCSPAEALPAGFTSLGFNGEREQDAPLVVEPATVPVSGRIRTGDVASIIAMGCQKSGIHVWVGATMPPGYPASAPLNIECRTCGLSILTRNRGSKRKAAAAKKRVPPVPAPILVPTSSLPECRIDPDLVLDALCFLGSGTWGSFEGLVAADLEQPWEALEVARNMVALGHLDVARKRGSGRIASWSVPPAALAYTGPGKAVLAGFRCDTLIEEVRRAITAAGGTVEVKGVAGQPAIVTVTGLEPATAEQAMAEVRDPLGREVSIAPDAATTLASASGRLTGLGLLLQPMTVGTPDYLQAYDLQAGKWRACEALAGPGAYRFQHAGQTYAYRDPNGSTFQGPHELVKLLAARDAAVNLHAYDAGRRVFLSALGCEPPGLLRRALVACTGKLPSRSGSNVSYDDVPPEVAAGVLKILYEEEYA